MKEPVTVGIIGLGFMGATHLQAYEQANRDGFPNRLVAVADADPDRRRGIASGAGNMEVASGKLFDPWSVGAYEDPLEMLQKEDVQLVSICTPTSTHVDLAIAALRAGKHVLLEKPVALTAAEVERLVESARGLDRLCMPAMCQRFWPGWSWLKEQIDQGTFGPVHSAVFRRLGSRPGWASFYQSADESGGALFDLHIHDADFIRFCFGEPDSVTSTGSLDHVTTLYRFQGAPEHVVAEGGWDHTAGFPFRMSFTVVFEEATADFDLGRDPELLLFKDGEGVPVEVSSLNGYDGEVRHLLQAISDGQARVEPTLEETVGLIRMLEQERASLDLT